jgi:hypothetical protein
MKTQKNNEIVITDNIPFTFPTIDAPKGDILIMGNFNGICGKFGESGDFFDSSFFNENGMTIIGAIKSGHRLVIAASKETIAYFNRVMEGLMAFDFFDEDNPRQQRKIIRRRVRVIDTTDIYNDINTVEGGTTNNIHLAVLNEIYKRIENMKFDIVIQNPPYNKDMHLDFFEKGLEHLTDTGKMIIIEPATWLINVRQNGKAKKKYNAIKEKIGGHIESIVIENYNKEFNTCLDVPFAITTIDMSKTFDTIDYTCCGEHKVVKSVYDCNLVGSYNTIWSIFNKILSLKTVMSEHIVESKKSQTKENKGFYFLGFTDGFLNALGTNSRDMLFTAPNDRVRSFHTLGEFASQYIECSYKGNIEYNIVPTGKKGNKMYCIYGTQTELENWKHFIFNNKLPLFLNIVLTIDQHNNSKDFLPWLVDKQYTDDEINKLFGFTDEEIKLINTTIRKYERNSPWFKRYMCGKDSVSDEEVNNFIAEITE